MKAPWTQEFQLRTESIYYCHFLHCLWTSGQVAAWPWQNPTIMNEQMVLREQGVISCAFQAANTMASMATILSGI